MPYKRSTQESTEAGQSMSVSIASKLSTDLPAGRAIIVSADATYGLYFAGQPTVQRTQLLLKGVVYDFSIVNASIAAASGYLRIIY